MTPPHELVDLNALDLPRLWRALIDEESLRRLVELARNEDLGYPAGPPRRDSPGPGDVTSRFTIASGRRERAVVRARRPGIVAGLEAVSLLLEAFGFEGRTLAVVQDGRRCAAGSEILVLEGELRGILAVERTLLNLLSRLSGVATMTSRYVEAISGTKARICDTRKTTPGYRALEKYAVRCGGGWLHRLGLHDAMLIKDNHLAGLEPQAVATRVAEAASAARASVPLRFVEVEVDSLAQLAAVLRLPEGTVDMVLLDNMAPAMLREAVAMRGARDRPLLEASGGVDLAGVRFIAETGVDRISVGAITHSAGILDLGLDIEGRTTA